MNLRTEPVRIYALIAGLLTAVGGALVAIGEGVDPLVAIGTAVVSFGLVVGGGELARTQAWAPAHHTAEIEVRDQMLDQVLSAEDALGRVTVDDVRQFDAPDDDPDTP